MADESGSNPSPEKDLLSTSPSPNAPIPSVPTRRILLLAEDNLPDALLVREAIRRENLPLDLNVVSDGKQAIDYIALAESNADAPHPEFLLLDLNLPKVDGFDVLRRLRASEKFKDLPVLVVSSSDSPADRQMAAELGAAYFHKPPSYEEYMKLGSVLKQFISREPN